MSKQTFTWFPEFESQLSQTPKVTVTKFGDGYEQRTPMGMNNNPEKWTLQFTLGGSDLRDVLSFINARAGVEGFYWTSPLGVTHTYVCRDWKTTFKQGHHVMNFDFEQVFEA